MTRFFAAPWLFLPVLLGLSLIASGEEAADNNNTISVDTSRKQMDETVCRRITPVHTNFAETVCYSRSRYQEMARDAQDVYRDMVDSGTQLQEVEVEVITAPE